MQLILHYIKITITEYKKIVTRTLNVCRLAESEALAVTVGCYMAVKTRSQAVARIADRTTSQHL